MGVSGRQGRRGRTSATSARPRVTGRTGRARADRGRGGALRVLLPRQKRDSADLLRCDRFCRRAAQLRVRGDPMGGAGRTAAVRFSGGRSEEHTSELQSLRHLVCRLLLENKETRTGTVSRTINYLNYSTQTTCALAL